MHYDSSFTSFINPTETQEDQKYEVIFYNEALTQIASAKNTTEVDSFVDRAIFKNEDMKNPVSMNGVA